MPKKAFFCKICITSCGRFRPDEALVVGCGNRVQAKM
ncbi:MAG: DUF6783 domain-containing protein [Ruminococcus sp.]